MVRNYVKKTKGPQYDENSLKSALHEVKSGHMTVFKAAKAFNVPYSTIYTNYKGIRGQIKKGKGRSTALALEYETKLATGVKTLEKWGFGLSRKELLSLVGQFVKVNNLPTPFKNSIPGEDWFIGFKKRYNLSIKKPQSIEFARRKATDPFTIFGYFDLLETTINSLGIKDKPGNIWNLDESSLCIDPSKTKVVGARGKSASRTTSGPGRENTTILLMANAAGEKAPPLIIYKGLHMWDQWCAPEGTGYPGTVYAASKKGWMETEIFQNYFQQTLIPSLGENRPALIIYDGHSTHISPEIIEIAIRENLTILKLPPHSSHLLQPLDLSVFKSFKDKWDAKLVSWQRQNIGRKLPKSLFSKFLGGTWNSITPEVIQSGFIKAGICPFNRTVIPDEKFCPQALYRYNLHKNKQSTLPQNENIGPNPESSASNHHQISTIIGSEHQTTSFTACPNSEPSTLNHHTIVSEPQPSLFDIVPNTEPSTSNSHSASVTIVPQPIKTFENLLLEMVKQNPIPQKTRRQRVGNGSEVLTNADVLERLKKKKKEKEQKKAKPKRRRKEMSSSEEEEEDIEYEESDNDQEFLENLEDEMEIQIQEEHDIINRDLDKDKWVLVKYTTKKNVKHFIGQITGAVEDDWEVKYLKRIATKHDIFKFEWSSIQDLDTVTESDIVKILPEPLTDRRGLLYFNVLFDGYNL